MCVQLRVAFSASKSAPSMNTHQIFERGTKKKEKGKAYAIFDNFIVSFLHCVFFFSFKSAFILIVCRIFAAIFCSFLTRIQLTRVCVFLFSRFCVENKFLTK